MARVAIITGSGRGIGAAAAKLAAKRGWAVCVNYMGRADRAEAVVQEIRAAGGKGGQGDAAPRRETLHQHPPALADVLLPPDHPVHRDEDVATRIRAVHERRVEGKVPTADIHSRVPRRNERERDADAEGESDRDLPAALHKNHAQDSARLGAERHANAEFLGALVDGETLHSVKAD